MQSETEMKERGAPPPYFDYPHPHIVPSQAVPPQAVPPQAFHPQPVIVGTATTVVPGVTTTVVIGNQMGSAPTVYICKSCHNQIITRVERKPSLRTHLFALLLCVVGCWPLVCLPYCVDSCNNAEHYCPNCNSYIGSYFG